MDPLKQLAEIKTELDVNRDDRERLIAERDPIILRAREAGHTWREIAHTLGMTEHGVIKAANRQK